jgi:hypothetical protein
LFALLRFWNIVKDFTFFLPFLLDMSGRITSSNWNFRVCLSASENKQIAMCRKRNIERISDYWFFPFTFLKMLVQSTAHQTVHFQLFTDLISWALALISNCMCKPWRFFWPHYLPRWYICDYFNVFSRVSICNSRIKLCYLTFSDIAINNSDPVFKITKKI